MRTHTTTALRSSVFWPCICLAAIVALVVPGPSMAAEKASEQVSPFVGSFSTAVPIDVPGFHGLEPRIALGYSSEGRNGLVGVGWGLSGFRAVQRANPGMGTPRFDSTDIFMLDGQELIPCQPPIVSPSCTSGGTHTTKIESYQKIRFDPASNQWTVWAKDGTRTTLSAVFDVPANSLVLGGTLRWGQTSVVDTKGNTVTYNWAAQDGDVYPDSVEYNGYGVKIYREGRPDPQSFAAASILGRTRHRIRSILVQLSSGTPIRAYKLTYTTSPVTGRSLLSAVQQYGKDVAIDGSGLITAGTSLPARTFTYQDDGLGKTFQAWEGAPSPPTTVEPVTWTSLVNTQAYGTGNSLTRIANGQNPWDASGVSTRAIVSGDGYLEFTVRFDGSKMAGLSNGNTDTGPNDIDFAWFETVFDGVGYARWWENGNYQDPPFTVREGDKLRVEVTAGVVHYKINGVTVRTSTRTPSYPLLVDTSFNGIGATINDAYISGALQDDAAWCQAVMSGGDFNGDGRSDQLCMNGLTPEVKIRLMTPNGFGLPTTWLTGDVGRLVLGDFNSDGKTDLGGYWGGEGNFAVAPSNGHGFEPHVAWGTAVAIDPVDGTLAACRVEPAQVGTGDFNGDGWTDVYCYDISTKRTFIGLSNGSSFTFSIFGSWGCDTWDGATGAMDFDGDAKDDWYCIGEQNARFLVFPSTGTSFGMALPGALDSSFCDPTGYVLGDLNGDGRADAACMPNGKVALSLGRGFIDAGTFGGWCTSGAVFASDVDGDGASELVCNNPGSGADDIQVRKWQNDSLGAAATWKGNWCSGSVGGGDFNGDGKSDLFCYQLEGAPAVAGTGGFVSDLMATASNGMGGSTQLVYTSSTAFENANNPGPKYTVTALTTQDGRGGSSTATYNYSGGLMDRFERRFLGFRQMRSTLPCIAGETACPYSDTWLKQDLASAGSPERVEYRDGSGQLLRGSESQYTTNGTTVPRVSLLTGQFAYTYSGGACPSWPCETGKRTYTRYTYNSYGNVTKTESMGDYAVSGDEVTVQRTYSPNATDYIVDRVATEQTLRPDGAIILTRTQHWYDGATSASQPPTQGYPTAVRRWLKTESRWVTRSMAWDNWGNLTSITDETGLPTSVVYDGTYHTFPISSTNSAGEGGSAVWDPVCGVATQKTDANSQVSVFQYDSLCRLTRTDLPLGAYEMRDYLDLGDPNLQRTWVRTPPAVAGTGKQYVMDYLARSPRV